MNIKTLPTKVAYNSDSPIQIIKSEIEEKDKKMFLNVKIANISNQPCISILLKARFVDSFNNYIGKDQYSFSAIDLYIPSRSSQNIIPIELDSSLNNARGLEIKIDTISFEDNQIKKIDESNNILFSEGRFTENELINLTEHFDKDIITYGEHLNTNWRCICGYINELNNNSCKFCNREKDIILTEYNKNNFKSKLSNNRDPIVTTNDTIEDLPVEEVFIDENTEDISFIKKFKKPIIGFLALAIAFTTFTLNKNKSFSQKLSTADKLLNDGSYIQALELYTELNNSKPSHELSDNIKLANELIESEENFKNAEQAIIENDYVTAVNYFKNISPNDKSNLEKVSNHKKNISNNIVNKTNNLIDKENYDEALELVNDYLSVDPTDTTIGDLKNNIYDLRENEIEAKKEEIKAKEETIKESENKTYFNDLGHSLKLTQTHVTSDKANLRYGANIDASVVKVVPKGSTVYIYDTIVEGTTRIWCDVRVQDAHTGEYYYGWLSNKTIAH